MSNRQFSADEVKAAILGAEQAFNAARGVWDDDICFPPQKASAEVSRIALLNLNID